MGVMTTDGGGGIGSVTGWNQQRDGWNSLWRLGNSAGMRGRIRLGSWREVRARRQGWMGESMGRRWLGEG